MTKQSKHGTFRPTNFTGKKKVVNKTRNTQPHGRYFYILSCSEIERHSIKLVPTIIIIYKCIRRCTLRLISIFFHFVFGWLDWKQYKRAQSISVSIDDKCGILPRLDWEPIESTGFDNGQYLKILLYETCHTKLLFDPFFTIRQFIDISSVKIFTFIDCCWLIKYGTNDVEMGLISSAVAFQQWLMRGSTKTIQINNQNEEILY